MCENICLEHSNGELWNSKHIIVFWLDEENLRKVPAPHITLSSTQLDQGVQELRVILHVQWRQIGYIVNHLPTSTYVWVLHGGALTFL